MKMSFSRRFLYPAIITVVVLLLAVVNHISGTWLLGWDSLSDEFNFKINAQRQFLGVWNEYQGLGTAGGHAHSSDIPRFLYLLITSLILPTNVLRYSYFFFTLLIGALGMFYFAKYLFRNQKYKRLLALSATSFYVFNLGTLQIFYVPFEMFNAQFMVLPWIFLFVIRFVKKGELKDYLWLCFFIFLGTPQGYAPVLYYALIGSIAGYLFIYLLTHSEKIKTFWRSVYVGAAFILLNLYWILPNFYYIKNYSEKVSGSKINTLFSEEAFLYSTKWGTWLDFPILRGFLFGWLDYKHTSGQVDYLMLFWRNYMANPIILSIGLAFFAIVVIGLFASVLKSKLSLIAFLPIFFLWLFMIIGANGVFLPVWQFLRENIDLFREGLRFPYSKFSVLLQFGYSIFFAFGLFYILSLLRKNNKFLKHIKSILILAVILPAIYMVPFFNGNLIAREMQIKLDPQYQRLFEFFEKQPSNTRVAYLPAHTLFGWNYYDWGGTGYQGAGFIWFGIPQAFLTRDFDRWHPANERFYTELQYAIYNEDPDLLDYVLRKYDVSYLLLDKNIIDTYETNSLFYDETENLLDEVENIGLLALIGNLKVYKYNDPTPSNSYVEVPRVTYNTRQIEFDKNHSYIDTNKFDGIYHYNDASKFELVGLENLSESNQLKIELKAEAKTELSNSSYSLSVPFVSKRESVPVEIILRNSQLNLSYLYPEVFASNGRNLFSNVPADVFPPVSTGSNQLLINGRLVQPQTQSFKTLIDGDSLLVEFSPTSSGVFDYSDTVYSSIPTDCKGVEGDVAKFYDRYPGSVGIQTIDGRTGCLNFEDRISNSSPVVYKVSFEYKNSDSTVPMYCLSETTEGKCLNFQYKNRPESSMGDFKYYEDYVLVENPEVVRFVLVSAADDQQSSTEAIFKNIEIERFSVSRIQNLLNPALRGLDKNIAVNEKDFPLIVKFPDYSGFSAGYLPGSAKFNASVRNCDEFSAKSYKRELKDSLGGEVYEYSSEDATSCDTLEANIINPSSSYLVDFDVKNIEGKPLDICFWGINLEKCMLQDNLDKNKALLFPSYKSSGGINININNTSIGRIKSVNQLSSIKVTYLPYSWLKEITIQNNSFEDDRIISGLEDFKVTKRSIYQYDLEVPLGSNNVEASIVLNQSYDRGWVILDKDSCMGGFITPLTCRKAFFNHYLHNGWANGWTLNIESRNYTIIFWPQLLQFFGYLVFIGTTGSLVIFYLLKRFINRFRKKA